MEKEKLLEYIKELEESYKQLMEIQHDICTKANEVLHHLAGEATWMTLLIAITRERAVYKLDNYLLLWTIGFK